MPDNKTIIMRRIIRLYSVDHYREYLAGWKSEGNRRIYNEMQ